MPTWIEPLLANWKTLTPGALLLLKAILSAYGVHIPIVTDIATESPATDALAGVGLVFAKDFNK